MFYFLFFCNNFNMQKGRIFGIKKSTILRAFCLLFLLAFVTYVFLSVFLLKNNVLWFFAFCIFVGVVQLVKSFLFRFDSALYLGTLLSMIGIFGHVFVLTNTFAYAPYFIALSFIAASIVTYILCHQKFQLIVAFSIFFVTIYFLLWTKNLITTSNLIAFVLPFLLLLLLEIVLICFHKK